MSDHHIAQLEPAARPLVPPGERYQLAVEVRNDLGATGPPPLGLNPLSWLEAIRQVVERGLFGRAVVGGAETIAGSLHRLVSEPTRDTTVLLVTDRCLRLVRLPPERSGSAPGATVVAEHPRAAVTGAEMAPYGVQRSRFVLAFRDGSQCALACLFASISRALVAALAAPHPTR